MGGRIIIRSSHQRFSPAGGTKKFHAEEARAIMFEASRFVPKPKPKPRVKSLRIPGDNEVRSVASEAAKIRRKYERIEHFAEALKVYCGLCVGFTDAYSVEEYCYLRLKQEVERRKMLRISTARAFLVNFSETVFSKIGETICAMADTGRRLRYESSRGYVWVMSTVGERSGQPCFLTLGEPNSYGCRPILKLQSKGEFRRKMRRRLKRYDREYRNYRPTARR